MVMNCSMLILMLNRKIFRKMTMSHSLKKYGLAKTMHYLPFSISLWDTFKITLWVAVGHRLSIKGIFCTFRMSGPFVMSSPSCAPGPDGQLLDASKIEWFKDPDDDFPIAH